MTILYHIKSQLKQLAIFSMLMMVSYCLAVPNNTKILQLAKQRYGIETVKTIKAWQHMLNSSQQDSTEKKLKTINNFFNHHIKFGKDVHIWGQLDYWATPLETMGHLKGDCEDFGIAKYISLLHAGIPSEQLRLVYVKARTGSISKNSVLPHMVVAFYHSTNADPLILDNLNKYILPSSQRQDLLPIFSFNSDGLWIQGQKNSVGVAQKRLSRWRNLLARLQAEGF